MYEYMFKNNVGYEGNTALNFYGNKLSYGQMFSLIDKVATSFVKIGVKPGDVVAVFSLSCVQSVLVFYALNKIGAVSSYLNVLVSEDDMKMLIMEGKTKHVVTLDLFAAKVLNASRKANVESVVVFSLQDYMPFSVGFLFSLKTRKMDRSFYSDSLVIKWFDFLKNGGNGTLKSEFCPDDICSYGHTGGTTGFPKSVLLRNKSFNTVAWQYVHKFEHDRKDVFLNLIVPFVNYGEIINMHMPLCLGLELVLIPKFDENEWPQYIKKYHVTHVCAIPAYISPILENKKMAHMDLSNLKTVGMGGEGMNIQLEQKLNAFLKERGSGARIIKGYGMTEVCATAATEYKDAQKIGSVGIPLVKNNFMIYDNDACAELPYMEQGEICMQCESAMSGYINNPGETNKLVREHPDGSKWIHTGDIGYIDEDGFVFVVGRMKRMIMTINDGMVYKAIPSLSEEVINSCNNVLESCVVGMKDGADIHLKAYIVLEADRTQSEDEVEKVARDECAKKLAQYLQPVAYEFIDSMPRTAAGKIDYRSLEEMN